MNHDFEAGALTGRATLIRDFATAYRQMGEFDAADQAEQSLRSLYERSDPLIMILAHERIDGMAWFKRLNPLLWRVIRSFQEAVADQDWKDAAYHARRLKRKAVVLWA